MKDKRNFEKQEQVKGREGKQRHIQRRKGKELEKDREGVVALQSLTMKSKVRKKKDLRKTGNGEVPFRAWNSCSSLLLKSICSSRTFWSSSAEGRDKGKRDEKERNRRLLEKSCRSLFRMVYAMIPLLTIKQKGLSYQDCTHPRGVRMFTYNLCYSNEHCLPFSMFSTSFFSGTGEAAPWLWSPENMRRFNFWFLSHI